MQKFESPWVEDRLRKIAALLIEAHRDGRSEILTHYAKRIANIEKASPKRQFMQLIQVYHPDRLAVFLKQIADCKVRNDTSGLESIEGLLAYDASEGFSSFHRRGRPETREASEKKPFDPEEYGFEENYSYGSDDFGYGEESQDSEFDFDGDAYEDEDAFARGTFMDAIKREFFGNLDLFPSQYEIMQFEGELDLSDYEIDDLSGVEFCVNVTGLNLAMNRIDNVWNLRELTRLDFLDLSSNQIENADELGELSSLQDLDLSFNEIDDIAFLLRLQSLKCVSLVGNPIKDKTVIEKLTSKGIVVIV